MAGNKDLLENDMALFRALSHTMEKGEYSDHLFSYDNPFNESFDLNQRSREYVDIQPSVNPTSARLISFLIRLKQAKRVLELGTSIGYSAIWLAEALRSTGGHLYTIDYHKRTGDEALKNFSQAGVSDLITFIRKDATEAVQEMEEPYDLIFMDCGKSLYPSFIDHFYRLLAPGGILIADDVLFHTESEVRPSLALQVHKFNELIKADRRFYSVVLKLGHGLSLSLKK